jgi:hypothetical protein
MTRKEIKAIKRYAESAAVIAALRAVDGEMPRGPAREEIEKAEAALDALASDPEHMATADPRNMK